MQERRSRTDHDYHGLARCRPSTSVDPGVRGKIGSQVNAHSRHSMTIGPNRELPTGEH
nr:hypothetical protein JVH1_0321 [Rhodococcus sp. JVH1]